VQADKVEFDPKNPGAALPLYAAAFREAGGVA
jgi:hypothetical protein